MSFLFDTQEEKKLPGATATRQRHRAADNDTEIALGTRSLLAIFFGLVLVCAIFFGLGYSVGRGSGTRAAAAPPIDASTPPDSHLSKPSPEQTLTPVETPPPATDSGSAAAPDDTPAAQASTPIRTPASAPSASPVPSPAIGSQNPARTPVTPPAARPGATLQPAAATLTTAFMVQVAAVRVPQDAEILVDALKKRGYTAAARNEPQDQLLHIQLGPFTSRSDAMAMRAKLLTDGYNAVIK